ncbi:hypothetical protein [Crenalkalicoccus roseus]|uniref:hypothetical protein n=1 Tax=Crenalkalicoccus roseus TaxID=1485588 RepID=UPI001081FE77|nr:hypothetical protein [Crenalkalicoccus roseus]
MRSSRLLTTALGAALLAGGLVIGQAGAQSQPQGGLGTPGGASTYGGQAGTSTMPNQVMPGTSAQPNVQGQAAGPRGAPAPGQPHPQAGGTSSQLSTGGQIRPGDPTGAAAGGPDTLGGGPGGSAGGSR